MEYPTVPSNVEGVRVVGFIPRLKTRVFSLLFNKSLRVQDSRVTFFSYADIFDQKISRPGGIEARSSSPSNTDTTAFYFDDGTNTGDGNPGFRYTTDGGGSWSDVN